MSETLKLGTDGNWATKEGSTLAYNDENGNFKPLPFNFERASGATRVNEQGLIEEVSNNEPRIDFSNDSNGALLLEPQSTNLITHSNDFSAPWVNTGGITVTPNFGISPSGDLNSTKLTFTGSTQRLYFNTGVTATEESASIYVKGVAGETIAFAKAGSIGAGDLFTLTGDWQRLEVSFTTATPGRTTVTISTNTGATAREIEIFGAQSESLSYATSYIPTQGSVGTRVAESCSQTPPSGIIGQTEGTMFVETSKWVESSNGRFFSISDGTTSNYIIIIQNTTFSNYAVYILNGGITQLAYSATNALPNNSKIAISYKLNDCVVSVNGEIVHTNTSVTLPSTSKIYIGSRENGAIEYYSSNPIKDARLYNTALSNAELQKLTS